jgi:hypothetical protein
MAAADGAFGLERIERLLAAAPPAHVGSLAAMFAGSRPEEERVQVVAEALRDSGQEWRDELGSWIADLLQVERLVPEPAASWRPLVRECMAFFAAHFPAYRLAPKIVEQAALPPDTPAETRLGLLIARTPGLQKLGQVLARTRRLSPSLRRELQTLENGIHDVTAGEVCGIVRSELGRCLEAYRVEPAPELLAEGSVSAVLEFTWFSYASGKRAEASSR